MADVLKCSELNMVIGPLLDFRANVSSPEFSSHSPNQSATKETAAPQEPPVDFPVFKMVAIFLHNFNDLLPPHCSSSCKNCPLLPEMLDVFVGRKLDGLRPTNRAWQRYF